MCSKKRKRDLGSTKHRTLCHLVTKFCMSNKMESTIYISIEVTKYYYINMCFEELKRNLGSTKDRTT